MALFPDNTYGFDSAGDPQVIPRLTFEKFKEFHRKYYHPSNAKIWFYGDDDRIERLRFLSVYLDMFDESSAPHDSKIAPQNLFSKPVKIIEKFPASEGDYLEKNCMVCLSWLLSEKPLDFETELALGFLDDLLMKYPSSPLRKILLESGLGDDLVGGGIEDELLQPIFSIGLKGVKEENLQKVEDLIMSTLEMLYEEGFVPGSVELTMRNFEFTLREYNSGSFPRGLLMMHCAIDKWIYDMDPFEALKYKGPFLALKERFAAGGSGAVFSPLIKRYILDNPHRVTIEMQPDPEKAAHDEENEKETLSRLKESMTSEDLAELACATEKLRLKQETPDPPEALKCVPSLSLQDIPKEPKRVPMEVCYINGAKVLQHDLFTNDIIYAEAVFNMSSLAPELIPLVPLFCLSIQKMGTKGLDFVQLNRLIGRRVGEISYHPFISSMRGKEKPFSGLIFQGKAMSSRTEDLFAVLNHSIQYAELNDQKRFKQLVSQSRASMENLLRDSARYVADLRMNGKLNTAGWIKEQMGGVSYLEYVRDLEEKVDECWPEIASSLEEIRKSIFSKPNCLINVTADRKNLLDAEKHVANFVDSLPSSSPASSAWSRKLPSTNEALVVPTQVNYVGKAANLYEAGYHLKGSAHVISRYIRNTWLWDRVRVSGGAYDGSCDFNSHSGVFSFMSNCDPNLLKTLDIYDGTSRFLRELEMDDDAITKAIIGTIGDATEYSSLELYLLGETEEETRKTREEILSTRLEDFREFADVLESVKDKWVAVAVASPDDVETAHKDCPGFFQVIKAL